MIQERMAEMAHARHATPFYNNFIYENPEHIQTDLVQCICLGLSYSEERS